MREDTQEEGPRGTRARLEPRYKQVVLLLWIYVASHGIIADRTNPVINPVIDFVSDSDKDHGTPRKKREAHRCLKIKKLEAFLYILH